MCHQLLHTLSDLPALLGRFAQNKALAKVMAHHPWRIQRATGMHHTPHHVVGRNSVVNLPVRIDGVQTRALECVSKLIEEPPRHTVHGCHDHGMGRQQWPHVAGNFQHAWGLDCHDDQILRTQIGSLIRCFDLGMVRDQTGLRLNALQSVFFQSLQCCAARHHADFVACLCQVGANPSANRACAVDANFHKR